MAFWQVLRSPLNHALRAEGYAGLPLFGPYPDMMRRGLPVIYEGARISTRLLMQDLGMAAMPAPSG